MSGETMKSFGRLGRITTGKKYMVKFGKKNQRSRYYARADSAFKKAFDECKTASTFVKLNGVVVAVFFKGTKDAIL